MPRPSNRIDLRDAPAHGATTSRPAQLSDAGQCWQGVTRTWPTRLGTPMPNSGVSAACCGSSSSSPSAGLLTYIAVLIFPVARDHRIQLFLGPRSAIQYHHHPSCHNHHHPNRSSHGEEWLQRTACLLLRAVCFLLLVSPASSMALRGNGGKPRWVNPCDLPGHVFDPSTDMQGAPPIRLGELFNSVRERARVAKEHAVHVKEHFLKLTFDDPDFVPGTAIHRQNWLPKIPDPKEQYLRGITKEEAFRKSFEFLQFFAVGIEQIILDQVIHDGPFVSLFRDVENHLTQVLCELQLGLFSLRVPVSADVMRDVMSQEYRDIGGRSRRNIRDYLILRDYIKATQFVAELFAHLERTL